MQSSLHVQFWLHFSGCTMPLERYPPETHHSPPREGTNYSGTCSFFRIERALNIELIWKLLKEVQVSQFSAPHPLHFPMNSIFPVRQHMSEAQILFRHYLKQMGQQVSVQTTHASQLYRFQNSGYTVCLSAFIELKTLHEQRQVPGKQTNTK